ncbi:hypothetical protein Adt_44116 [Abeliophyllum distichum]|uniref:Uncharacterized protein n=1 Tax=Abeliophyllum distichum TaxID=126358 RepID=A0ABD1P9Y6_9LAMI
MLTQTINYDVRELEEEEEVLKLEEEVEQIAQKVVQYRTSLPEELASLLAFQRPTTHPGDGRSKTKAHPAPGQESESGRSLGTGRHLESGNTASLVGVVQEEAERIQFLKQKISSNTSIMPIVLNRIQGYMARMDKLESLNGIIHPAFKRKGIS